MKSRIITSIISLVALCMVLGTQAQSNFEKVMISNLKAWGEAKTPEQVEQVRNKFIRIGDAEKGEWLPYYYAAEMFILEGFSTKDANRISLILAESEKLIEKVRAIDGYSETEVLILEGLKNTVLIANDPATYGPKLSAATVGIYEKAKALEPKNPRAHYLSAEFEMGGAKFFGKPVDEYCARFDKALVLFEEEKPQSDIHPQWGKDRLLTLIEQCKADATNN